ncbi:NAD(P) transhydrogenase subunit alpha [Reichenbachiella sp. MALMAid0571]|uniref:NAD(P) transhydrogenase subunit alpha n=1 Tax=Reichenbachiella sp. MALMAid0571 TaxID=3143939 RepID=UPI0032DEEBC7
MIIGLLKCTEESLVGLIPNVVSKLKKEGHDIVFEPGAGSSSDYTDQEYLSAGATSLERREILIKADVLITVSGLKADDLSVINDTSYVIGKFNSNVELVEKIKSNGIKAFSLDLLPRSTIAQSMDVLSSLASLSGYKSIITAADNFSGYFPMMTTSAGTIPPAKVLVLGAGVAGLQAIATARRLGAVVEAFDVRSSVKEEVQSLGAKFIEVEGSQEDVSAGGYAVKQSEEYIQKQKELIHVSAAKADVIVTTAAIPGRKAPLLIEDRTVTSMKKGSVIVDLAAATGGNCALTQNDKIVEVEGVTIIGDSRLYNKMGKQASLVYSNNVFSFLKFVFKEGLENIPYGHEIVSKTLLTTTKTEAVSA